MSGASAVSDPYEILQVQRGAEHEVVRAAYRALAAKWHPDRGASPERMVAINAAWRIVGDPVRRAAHDAGGPVGATAAADDHQSDGARGAGLPARPPRETRSTDSLLDFGRYAGLTVSQLVDQDADDAVWLARTSIGRRLAPEIDAALVRQEAQLADLAPKAPPVRRSFLPRRVREAR